MICAQRRIKPGYRPRWEHCWCCGGLNPVKHSVLSNDSAVLLAFPPSSRPNLAYEDLDLKTSLFNRTLLLSAIAAISLPLNAQTRLDPLVVTVTTPLRMSQPVDQTLAATTVITRADIERLQPESVAQLLRGTAGVEFASNGGAGSVTSLFMRGTESKHTLVLIDGVKINSPTDGRASWNFLPVSQIERIEIVRGPQSSVWGADAIGGVVNIITRKHAQMGTQGQIRMGAGQQNTKFTDAFLSTANQTTRFSSGINYKESNGFNALSTDPTGDRDGYTHYGLNLKLEHDVNANNTLSAGYLRNQGDNLYDNCSDENWNSSNNCKDDFVLQTFNFDWSHKLNDDWILDTSLQRIDEKTKQFFEGNTNSQLNTQRDQLSVKALLDTNEYNFVTGVDFQRERILKDWNPTREPFSRDRRDILGVFAQTQFKLTDDWTLSAGIRHDDDEFFGNKTTGNLGFDWQVNNEHNLGTIVSQGYRAPNLMELYGPSLWGANPNLKAEDSLNYEMYWQYRPNSALNAEVRLFQNEIDNLIVWSTGKNLNVNQSRIHGAEVSVGYKLNNWTFNGSMTFQNPKNLEKDSLLLRRSRESGKLNVDYAVSNWGTGVTIEGQSKRYDFDNQRMGGYALVNTRAHWHLSPDWTLRAKIDNLFDKDYEQAAGYNTQGRYFETSLTYRF